MSLENNQEIINEQEIKKEASSSSNELSYIKDDKETKKAAPARKSLSPNGFIEKVVQIKRISKTTKGGRAMRFSAVVVIGDKKGQVGFGMGKSIEVPDAIKKAIKNANNNIHRVKMTKKGTIFHENIARLGASRILIKPAPEGTGIIAGGSVRAVVELAGYSDIYTKVLGSSTPINAIRTTVKALEEQFTPNEIKKLRSKNDD